MLKTGLIKRETWTDRDGKVKGMRESVYSNYDGKEGYKALSKEKFIKTFTCLSLENILNSPSEEGQLNRLITRINTDNLIMSHKNVRPLPARMKDLAVIIGVNEISTRKLIRKWQRLGLVYILTAGIKDKKGNKIEYFYINPLLAMNSAYMNVKLYGFFRDIMGKYLTQIEIKDLEEILGIQDADPARDVNYFEDGLAGLELSVPTLTKDCPF